MKWTVERLSLGCAPLAVLVVAVAAFCQAASGQPAGVENPERLRQARKILGECRRFERLAGEYIAQAGKEIEQAKKLRGTANIYRSNLNAVHAAVLKGKTLQAAQKQFKTDCAEFARHADEYRLHTDQVRRQFGLCQASLQAYEELRKDYSLHCAQFHLPDVPPPHLCLETDSALARASADANQVRAMRQETQAEQLALGEAERKLQIQLLQSGVVDSMVMKKSALALQEQELAAEFARLKEEHRQLDIARKAISASGGKVAVPQVKGTVKP